MNEEEEHPFFNENELSADDLAVLQAFEAIEDWNVAMSPPPATATDAPVERWRLSPSETAADETLIQLFASEVREDINKMCCALNQLEQDDHISQVHFVPFKRAAHKIRGTAGAVNCPYTSIIAQHIETIVKQISQCTIFPVLGINALKKGVKALEDTLTSLTEHGSENNTPLLSLEVDLRDLGIDLESEEVLTTTPLRSNPTPSTGELTELAAPSQRPPAISPEVYTRVNSRCLAQLVRHVERLAQLRTPLEGAQAQAKSALQELHAAQNRLQQLETKISTLLIANKPLPSLSEFTTAPLIARILRQDQHNSSRSQTSVTWEELEHSIDRDFLQRSVGEAIADVTLASSRVHAAFARLEKTMQEYTLQSASIYSHLHLLRLVPISVLIPELRQTIQASPLAQTQELVFEATGAETKVDHALLEALLAPLQILISTCIADPAVRPQKTPHIWLAAQEIGHEINIEVGFSLTVHGGAVEAISGSIQQLKGTLTLRRNNVGGVSFHLRLPRPQGIVHGLLLRSGHERVIVPFSQVWHIVDGKHETLDSLYTLHELLSLPHTSHKESRVQPVLVIAPDVVSKRVGITVDEVIDEVKLVIKPLPSYLQRPGITGAAVDNSGKVTLMLDLAALISHYVSTQRRTYPTIARDGAAEVDEQHEQPKILIADDSVYLRHSLQQELAHEQYTVLEARDGMEALEQLLEHMPDVFLLDVEMPNLNGYDVLQIMHLYPELSSVKVIMLTSRATEKHIQRAFQLGAYMYLVKPYQLETLLMAIRETLQNSAQ